MKNTIKLIGIIALAAVIGFSMAACGDGSGGSDDDAVYLRANRWDNSPTDRGHDWNSGDQIKLSDFTDVKPSKDDTLKFKMSGTIDKTIEWPLIALFQNYTGKDDYIWIGDTGADTSVMATLSGSFTDYSFEIPIKWPNEGFDSNHPIFVEIVNSLWKVSGSNVYGSDTRLPANVEKGTIMATIRDFKISLVP